jgi:pilus assembly protein CpaE
MNMADMDGVETTEQLTRRVPGAAVVMMSIQGDADYLRRAMLAGAREFLVKPFGADELMASLRAVHARNSERRIARPVPVGPAPVAVSVAPAQPQQRGRVVAVFSPKGGVGTSTLAVNVAVAAASELGKKVALVDCSFQFGDVGLLLNLNPRSASITDVLGEGSADDRSESIDTALVVHQSGVRVLLPPPSPEMAELVTPANARTIVERLRDQHELVILDCPSTLHEPTLSLLDLADEVLCVTTLDLTSIKSVRMFVAVSDRLGYGPGKLKVVLNRVDSGHGISVSDVARSIGRKVDHTVASDARTVVNALNRGEPFFTHSGRAYISRDVAAVARSLIEPVDMAEVPAATAPPPTASRRLVLARR